MSESTTIPGSAAQERRLRKWYFPGFALLVTLVTYLGTLRYEFVFDDDPQIRNNPFVRSWGYVPQYFYSSVWKNIYPLVSGNYYRPMFQLWLRANDAVFGLHAMGWHLTTVLLHVLVTWLVYRVVFKLTGRFTAAWLTALIFGLHPIHHEAVAWVSGTTESLFAAFFLAAFLAYLRSRDGFRTIWMAVSACGYGLALLSKETAIILPVLVFATEWISDQPSERPASSGFVRRFGQALIPVTYYVPVAAAYFLARTRVLSGFGHAVSDASVTSWLLTLPSILFFYVKHWFFPVGLSEFYDVPYQTRLSVTEVILPAAALLTLAYAAWRLRKPLGIQSVKYAVAWLVIPLLPALDTFVFANGELVHDRYFYVPSIGASLLLALIVERVFAGERAVFGQPLRILGAALALAVILGFCANWETSYWQDNYTLYVRGHQIAPQNPTALNNLGGELIVQREIELAQPLLESGYRAFPGDGRIAYNLGRLNYIKKEYPKSEGYARDAIRLDPITADSYVLLAQALLKQDKSPEAIENLRRAVDLNPYDPTYHTSYGIVLRMTGDCSSAATQFDQAIAINPADGMAHLQLQACKATPDSSQNSAK